MISLYDMLEAADGQLFGEPAAHIFTDFAVEVDQVEQGCLFVALKTDRGDGHLHLEEAVQRGALGLVCAQPPDFDTEGLTVMIVRDVETALMNWARIVMRKFGTATIGVSGSAGKSTTREMIAAVLGTRYQVYNNPGGVAGRLGLPLALGKLSAQDELAVLELSTDQPGEMAQLMEIAQPLVGVVTNVGYSHLDQPDDLARAAEEKTALVAGLPEGGLAVLNYDSELVRGMAEATKATVLSVGIDSFDADLLAYNIVVGRYKTGFDLRYGAERYVGRWVPLLGRHQIYAVMIGLAIGLSYQITIEEGLRALTQVEPLPGRLRPLNGRGGCLLVDDTFSASPLSTQAALEWLGSVRGEKGRLIFVMGDLDHLGNYAQRAHRQLGEQVAGVADRFVTQGNLAAIAGRAALDYGMPRHQVRLTYSHRDACLVLDDLGPHDVVLVKGSRSARMDEVVRQLLREEADVRLLAQRMTEVDQAWSSQAAWPSWVEVDLTAMADNVRRLREMLGPEVALMAMVPADAYGHGAVASAATAVMNGAAYLGVASLEEAITLRNAGIEAPILVEGYIPLRGIRDAIHYNITVTLYELDFARLCNRIAADMGRQLRMHVNIDTGMGRLGLLPGQVMSFFRSLRTLRYLEVEGIYTELAAATEDSSYTQRQLEVFESQLSPLLATGLTFKYIHAANTAALLTMPESHFTMVRAGSILHGLVPSRQVPLPEGFRPTLCWKTVIAQTKRLPPGSYVGGGRRYRATGEERLAVIPVGYTDGFRSEPYHWREVLVRGQRVPVIGHVGLHEATLDISAVPACQPGDEVVLIGEQGEEAITAEEVAGWLETTAYELLSTILTRVPRL